MNKLFKFTISLFTFIFILNISNSKVFAKSFLEATPENPYTISVIGDSISFEPSYTTILNTNPLINVTTDAIGGTRVAGKENASNFVNRTKYVRYNSDLILIFGGTNDYFGLGISSPIGDATSTDIDTFYGAYNAMIKNLKLNNPNSKIVLITPIRRMEDENLNIYGCNLFNYAYAVQDIALSNGLMCIDLFNNKECDFINNKYRLNGVNINFSTYAKTKSLTLKNELIPDGLHPSWEGHKIIADELMKYIQTF